MRIVPPRRSLIALVATLAVGSVSGVAVANHIKGEKCGSCASHKYWPRMEKSDVQKAPKRGGTLQGTSGNDELLGWHGSDTIHGGAASDVIWGDFDPRNNSATQRDTIYGEDGNDFIYSSHGYNRIEGGAGNDAISAHYGHGIINCGPGRDIYHVPRTRKGNWKIKNCEKVDRRSERQRGGLGLKPLK